MREQEILNKIRESAQSVEIPERLKPEQVEARLKEQKKSVKFRWQAMHLVAAAAVLVVVLGVLPIGSIKCKVAPDGVANESINDENSKKENLNNNQNEGAGNENGKKLTAGMDVEEGVIEKKKDAGELYQVAESYEEIYDFLKKNEEMMHRYNHVADLEMGIEETVTVDRAESMTDGAATDSSMAVNGTVSENGAVKEESVAVESAAKGYSTTNLQMAGVDESDIVKTNGSHIFIVKDGVVQVVELKSGEMTLAGSISPQLESFSDRVLEMYVDGDKLILITQQVKEGLEGTSAGKKTGGYLPVTESMEVACVDMAYQFDVNYQTVLYTYDISNPAKAEQIGRVEQDGYYKTSRKIGDIVYLFTQENIGLETELLSESEEEFMELLPKVNGERISYDDIYLPKQGLQGLVISSVSMDKPEGIVDNILIMNDYVEIYVSSGAVYLYYSDYSVDTLDTQIAKFSLKEGKISAVAAASIPGTVQDTFAINEYEGNLRILTSYWNRTIEENTNQLYILDENLNPAGKIEHIAEGETIYAARYFGDLAYFITYRNIDPLFAADLSDIRNPKILGELKITGYSEYLHMWGEDKLLGIGYETDEEDGRRKGIKLVMFDISNPKELSILDTVVLENADNSAAVYNYKCVLADNSTNMIGFTTVDYSKDELMYHVYSFQNGKFEEELVVCEEEIYNDESYRGLWAGAYFYIVNQREVKSYKYLNDYEVVDKMDISLTK